MFAVETKKKKEKMCARKIVFWESKFYRLQIASVTEIWSESLTLKLLFLIFLFFNIMRYKKLIKSKVYMFAGSVC